MNMRIMLGKQGHKYVDIIGKLALDSKGCRCTHFARTYLSKSSARVIYNWQLMIV